MIKQQMKCRNSKKYRIKKWIAHNWVGVLTDCIATLLLFITIFILPHFLH